MLWANTSKADVLVKDNEEKSKSYYEDSKRGWYWYEQEKKEKEKKEVKKEVKTEPKEEPQKEVKHRIPSLKDYDYNSLWNMHPDDFQALLTDFQKKAVMAPTEENVKEYYFVQDLARRKAMAFTNVTAYVMQKNPDLQVENDYPNVTPGRAEYITAISKGKSSKIRQGSDDFALIYFFSPGCQYCMTQNSILKFFEDKYKWEVKKVNVEENMAAVARFNITNVPFVILIYKKSEDYLAVTKGPISLEEMEDRIYEGIRLFLGETKPENFSLPGFQAGTTFDVNASPIKKGGSNEK